LQKNNGWFQVCRKCAVNVSWKVSYSHFLENFVFWSFYSQIAFNQKLWLQLKISNNKKNKPVARKSMKNYTILCYAIYYILFYAIWILFTWRIAQDDSVTTIWRHLSSIILEYYRFSKKFKNISVLKYYGKVLNFSKKTRFFRKF
jgi:hypothetical protein